MLSPLMSKKENGVVCKYPGEYRQTLTKIFKFKKNETSP